MQNTYPPVDTILYTFEFKFGFKKSSVKIAPMHLITPVCLGISLSGSHTSKFYSFTFINVINLLLYFYLSDQLKGTQNCVCLVHISEILSLYPGTFCTDRKL